MTDLPLEIIDHVLTFVDASSLYELGRVSHVLQLLSKKHLYRNHIQHASIRLWMHQPGTRAHTPIDFGLSSTMDPLTARFTFTNHPIRFDPKKPVYVDGCTIIIHPNPIQPSRQHYGITYQQPALMKSTIIATSASSSLWIMEKQGQWAMHGEQGVDGLFKPSTMSCNLNLFNPTSLDAVLQQQTIRLQERIQTKRLQSTPRGSMTMVTGLSTASSSSPKESCSAKSLSVVSTSSPARSKHSSSLFTSISS